MGCSPPQFLGGDLHPPSAVVPQASPHQGKKFPGTEGTFPKQCRNCWLRGQEAPESEDFINSGDLMSREICGHAGRAPLAHLKARRLRKHFKEWQWGWGVGLGATHAFQGPKKSKKLLQ